jgi:ankyrin repeat protein
LAVVELLLANGADIWQKGSDGKMPIELCATLPMFKLYVAKQKDLVQTDQGSILLSLFQSSDRRDLAQYMLDQGGLPRGAAIILAGLDPEKDRDMVNLLVKNGVLTRHSNLGPYAGPTPLDFAIFNMYQVVGTENPFGIDDSGEIVIKRNRPMALWLIANGCPIDLLSGNERRSCPLNKAIEHNEIEIVKALIDKGVNLTPQLLTRNTGGGSTHTEPTRALPPLMVAVDSSLDMMKLLVERGVDVNAADPETGRTPLHWAALRNKRDAAEYLLGEGANPRAKTKAFPPNPGGNGIPPFPGSPAETPSQVAAGRGHTELAAFLKSKE